MLIYGPARPKSPPHGKEGRNKVTDRRELHCATVKVRLECVGEMSAVDCLGPFCSIIIFFA